MISQDPWKIRQDPSTATPVGMASTNPTTITLRRHGSSPMQAKQPYARTENWKGGEANNDRGDTMMLPLYIPACGVSPAKKAVFFFLRNPSSSMDHACYFLLCTPCLFIFPSSLSGITAMPTARATIITNSFITFSSSFSCQIRFCVCRDFWALVRFKGEPI